MGQVQINEIEINFYSIFKKCTDSKKILTDITFDFNNVLGNVEINIKIKKRFRSLFNC